MWARILEDTAAAYTTHWFPQVHILQGSVATHLSWGDIFYYKMSCSERAS